MLEEYTMCDISCKIYTKQYTYNATLALVSKSKI